MVDGPPPRPMSVCVPTMLWQTMPPLRTGVKPNMRQVVWHHGVRAPEAKPAFTGRRVFEASMYSSRCPQRVSSSTLALRFPSVFPLVPRMSCHKSGRAGATAAFTAPAFHTRSMPPCRERGEIEATEITAFPGNAEDAPPAERNACVPRAMASPIVPSSRMRHAH